MSRSLVQPITTVDLAVEIPGTCLPSRAIKNHGYSDKRAMYLGVLAEACISSGLCKSVKVEAWQCDPSKQVLILHLARQPTGGQPSGAGRPRSSSIGSAVSDGSKASKAANAVPHGIRIRLIPTISGSTFSPSVLSPAWNNVRPWAITGVAPGSDAAAAAQESDATPHHNMSIAEDVGVRHMAAATHAALASCPGAVAALVVAKAWARRRGWHRCSDGLSSLLVTAIMVHLIQNGKVISAMAPLQCLRIFFSFLATTDLSQTTIVLQPAAAAAAKSSPVKEGAGGEDEDEDDGIEDDAAGDSAGSGGSDDDDTDDDDDADDVAGDNDDIDEDDGDDDFHAESSTAAASSSESALDRLAAVDATTIAVHRSAFPVVIISPCGIVNMAHRMSAAAAVEVRLEAKIASMAVGGTGSSSPAADATLLESVLGTTVYPALRYDRIITAPLPPCPVMQLPPPVKSVDTTAGTNSKAAAPNGKGATATQPAAQQQAQLPAALQSALCDRMSWTDVVASSATHILKLALTDRVDLTRVVPVYPHGAAAGASTSSAGQRWPCPEPFTWSLDAQPPRPTCLWVCINTSLEAGGGVAARMVDKGPRPEDTARARPYINLWGEQGKGAKDGLAELRRFADGAVQWAVVWDASKLGGRGHARQAIVPLIVCRMLARHCGIAMPVSVLHAGDAIVMVVGDGSGASASSGRDNEGADSSLVGSSSSAAAAIVAADASRACPSLALERMLDAGGYASVATRVTYGNNNSSSSEGTGASLAYSPLTGLPCLSDPVPVTVSAATVPPTLPPSSDPLAKGPVNAFVTAISALEWLSTAMKGCSGMPVKVSSCQAIAPELRYTAPHAPAPHPLASGGGGAAKSSSAAAASSGGDDALAALLGGGGSGGKGVVMDSTTLLAMGNAAHESFDNLLAASGSATASSSDGAGPTACQTAAAIEVVFTLESTSKWPDDPDAITALKTAFYLKLQYGLSSAHRGLLVARASSDWLDVMVGGFVFRLYLHVEREMAVLQGIARRQPLAKANNQRKVAVGDDVDIEEEGDGDAEGDDDGDGDEAAPRKRPAVRGFINVAPVGATRPEAAPKMKHRRATSEASGFDVTGHMSREALAAQVREVFGMGGGGTAGSAAAGGGRMTATAAGARLDALYLRGVARPTHASLIHALAQRHSAYGPAVRLACLWMQSHMVGPEPGPAAGASAVPSPDSCLIGHGEGLVSGTSGLGPHVAIETIELMMAHVFTSPHPFRTVPGTPTLALMRFLHLLGHHDWAGEPLLVDPQADVDESAGGAGSASSAAAATAPSIAGVGGTIQPGDRRVLMARFKEARAGGGSGGGGSGTGSGYVSYPPASSSSSSSATANSSHHPGGPSMYIVTPRERSTGWRPVWSRLGPSWHVLGRVVALARQAEGVLASALAPCVHASSAAAASSAPKPAASTSSSSRAARPSHPFFFGRGTSLLALWQQHQPHHQALDFTAALKPSTAVYHAVIDIKAGSMVPRADLDGRYCGPVKQPLTCAAALALTPIDMVLPVVEAAAAARAAARAKVAAGGGSSLSLVVNEADAAASGKATGSKLIVPLPLPMHADTSKLQLQLFKNLASRSRDALLVGADPVPCYLRALRLTYGRYAHFFVNSSNPSTIGVLWRPGAFKVLLPETKKSGVAAVNASSIGPAAVSIRAATGGEDTAAGKASAALLSRLLPLISGMAQSGAGLVRTAKLQS